jgi:uncharacterized membrane protein
MDDTSAFCNKCGHQVAAVSPAPTPTVTAGALPDNVAGMLAYVTIIPAIFFLLIAPYNYNRFVRFHAYQCLFTAAAWILLEIVLMAIPFLGWMILRVIWLAGVALWIVLLIKAYQGEKWKLPVIGDMAEKQADAV